MPKIPVTGLNKGSIDRIQKELLNKCNLIEPRYLPVVEPSTYDGKDILIIWAPGGDDRPYKCPIMLNSEGVSKKSEKVYQDEHNIPRIMKRKCKRCGKTFTFPSTIKHYPNYCKDCRAKFKEKKA